MASITSNPSRVWFGLASFSAVLFLVELTSTDASQPCAPYRRQSEL
jgi:hypothetical protein